MNRSILVLLVLFLSFCYGHHDSNRYGILYINEILANSDTHTVQIEQSIVQENQITTDKIEEWTGNGIIVENVFIKDENVELFNDFYVLPRVIFPGRCDFNGGLVSDSPYVDLFSFHIIDDTGDTSLRGTLYPGKGLNVNEGAFVIVDGSAETRIRDQLLHANGGINVLDGNFIVDGVTGDISNREITHVVGDIFVGTSEDNAPRYIARQATTNLIGKDAYLIAQDGALTGGDIIVLPGVGSERNGNIFFGREGFGDHIVVTRQLEFSTDTGGDTFIQAQDSLIGAGGDFYLIGGDSTDNGSGGNIVLSPGVSDQGNQGQIYFGTTVQELAAFDMYIARPILDGGNGGDTFLRGQSTENGDAGNLQVRAGTIPENADSFGGDLHISPGLDENENHGIIYIGANKASDLIITRYTIPSLGGATLLRGQPSTDGNGGDLYLWAGDSGGNGNGGDIYFVPGTTPVTNNGDIYLGLQTDLIEIDRPVQNNPLFVTGAATTISGQDSAGAGGDLYLLGGDGSSGGDIFLEAGDGFSDPGGNLNIAAGYGNAFGGDVTISAASTNAIGGDVVFDAGDGNGARGGDIFLNPGSGFTNGVVTFGPVASAVDITGNAPLVVENSLVVLQSAANQLLLQPVSNRILVHNGLQLLRNKSDVFVIDVDTSAVTGANQYERVRELQNTLNALINSFAQCQHGLVQTVTASGVPRDCADFS